MEIFAKAALDLDQIAVKENIGCDGIEIQLLDELQNWNVDNLDIKQFYNKNNIRVVHAPLVDKSGNLINLEDFLGDEKVLRNVCKIAEYFGKINKLTPVSVVFHTTLSKDILRNVYMRYKIMDMLEHILYECPHIQILIENVIPFDNKKETMYLCNNFLFDNVELVKFLRNELWTNRIGTVLDTCHAKISLDYYNVINKVMGFAYPEYTLEDYFRENKDVVELIHLADRKGPGFGKGNHGTVPSKEEMQEFLDLYEKYGYSCPITLEVAEDNYSTCTNYKRARGKLIKLLQKERKYDLFYE